MTAASICSESDYTLMFFIRSSEYSLRSIDIRKFYIAQNILSSKNTCSAFLIRCCLLMNGSETIRHIQHIYWYILELGSSSKKRLRRKGSWTSREKKYTNGWKTKTLTTALESTCPKKKTLQLVGEAIVSWNWRGRPAHADAHDRAAGPRSGSTAELCGRKSPVASLCDSRRRRYPGKMEPQSLNPPPPTHPSNFMSIRESSCAWS